MFSYIIAGLLTGADAHYDHPQRRNWNVLAYTLSFRERTICVGLVFGWDNENNNFNMKGLGRTRRQEG